jgi:hypothetical protein
MNGVYNLKVMAAARLLAEVTVLVALVLVPVTLIFCGAYAHMPWQARGLSSVACAVAIILLSAYGFVTYRVKVSDDGIETFSAFRSQFLAWRNIKSLHLKTAWGMRRYLVKADEGMEDLTFPIWLNGVKLLCQSIRARLPKGETGGAGGAKVYRLAPSAVAVQLARLLGGLLIIGLFWQFALTMKHDPQHSADHIFMLGVCTIFSLFWLAHATMSIIAPNLLITDVDGLQLISVLGNHRLTWSQLRSMSPASFLLPEGLIVRTQSAFYFISDQLDAFDELEDDVAKWLPLPPVSKNDRQKNV